MRNGGFTLTPVGDLDDTRTAKDFGMIMERTSKRPFLPGTVDTTVSIAGMHGAYDFGATLASAQFGLDCAMIKRTPYQLQATADALGTFLLDAAGRPRQMLLVFDLKADKQYTARYSGSLDFERLVGLGRFTLPFVAHDPFSYQTDISTGITWDSNVSMDNEGLTFDDVFTFSVPGAGTHAVNNFGAFEVWPIIEIVGSFTTLSISTGGRTLVYNEALNNGTLTIDNQKMQAKFGAVNKNNKVSGQWIKLAPGQNTVTIGGTGLNCSVSFVFRAKYL